MKEALGNVFFFFFFLGVTYSRILKKQKYINRLAIAMFLKSVAIGPPKKEVYLVSFKIFGCLTYSCVFKKRGYRSNSIKFLKFYSRIS